MSNVKPLVITNNQFTDNFTGAQVMGSLMSLTVTDNVFKIPFGYAGSSQYNPNPSINGYPNAIGLHLFRDRGYGVYNNIFRPGTGSYPLGYTSKKRMGILVNNGHFEDEEINLNYFDKLWFSSIANGLNGSYSANKGLQFRCNTFDDGSRYDISRIAKVYEHTPYSYLAIRLRSQQGMCGLNSNATAANNSLENSCVTTNNKLFVDISPSQTVNYNFAASNIAYDPGSCHTVGYTTTACFGLSGFGCIPPDGNETGLKDSIDHIEDILDTMNIANPEFDQLLTERRLYVQKLARYYANTDNNRGAAEILEAYEDYAAAIPFYAAAGMWTEAYAAHANLPLGTDEEELYAWLTGKGLDLYSIDSTWEDLDSTSADSLTHIDQFVAYEGSLSGALAERLGVGSLNWYFPDFDTSVTLPDVEDTVEETDEEERLLNQGGAITPGLKNLVQEKLQFSLYPNPTNGNFIIECNMAGEVQISSIDGKLMATYKVREGKNELKLPAGMAAGLYMSKYKPLIGLPVNKRLMYQP